ncbi:MAG TPA: amidohydrolase [Planctomycetaceae bacterium]|nr:amidohydrolase [Blastopirellula sp.]HAY82539.1 amidohydrolase [Planctomycetaceae bacterium]
MKLTRRQFVSATATTMGALRLSGMSHAADDSQQIPIIDTHQHLWDLDKFKCPWHEGAPEVLKKSYVTSDYLAATQGLNVVKAVYMEVNVLEKQQNQEADHVVSLCKSDQHPTVAAVISGRPNSRKFKKYMRRFAKSPYIRGIREVLHDPDKPQGLCLQPQFVKSMQLLGDMNMSFDLCMRPMELDDGWKLAKQCPDTRFIVDHCGNADPKAFLKQDSDKEPWHTVDAWKRSVDRLAGLDNVTMKISGIIARAPEGWSAEHLAPIIDFCLLQFGPDRVVFGGDWPVCLLGGPYAQWVGALKEVIASRPLADQRKLLSGNAERLYRLS